MRSDSIERLLPAVVARTRLPGSPLAALLEAMEALHEPSEDVLARLADHLNPYRAPDAFVPYLAGWVDLDQLLVDDPLGGGTPRPFETGVGRLRELVALAAWHARRSGTAGGLVHLLRTATGLDGFTVEEPRPFHFRVVAPPAARRYERLLRRILDAERPAYLTAELTFA